MSRGLKALAMSENLPLLILAQWNNEGVQSHMTLTGLCFLCRRKRSLGLLLRFFPFGSSSRKTAMDRAGKGDWMGR